MKDLYERPNLVVDLFQMDDVMTFSSGDNDIEDPWD